MDGVSASQVRDASKQRDFQIPEGCQVTTDQSEVLADPDIDMVVEMMGGVDDAKRLVFGALSGGKHVVTANKALVAAYMTKLLSTLDGKDTRLGLEAAVCGGIPIIHTLQRDYGLASWTGLAMPPPAARSAAAWRPVESGAAVGEKTR